MSPDKPKYLNHMLLGIIMIGYTGFLILMAAFDIYQIWQYQNRNDQSIQTALEDCVANIQETMEDIDGQLFSVFTSDTDFDGLSKSADSVRNFSNAYNLRESLKVRMMSNEGWDGFAIYYDNGRKSWYYMTETEYSSPDAVDLNHILQERYLLGDGIRTWEVAETDGQVSLVIMYGKGRAAVYGVTALGGLGTTLEEETAQDLTVILLDDTGVYGDADTAEKLNLTSCIEKYEEVFDLRIQNYQVYGRRISNTDLWVVCLRQRSLWSILSVSQLFLLVITVLSVFAVGLLYQFLKKEVIRPIRQLTGILNAVRRGELTEVPKSPSRYAELREVNEVLNQMIHELEEQKLLTYEEVIEKQRAQMQYLQLQLKPHFYLNGLKTLNALAASGQTDKMQELIFNLSSHLRYFLQTEREVVPLFEELDFTRNYVELQKHVSGRPVTLTVEEDEETENWLVPVLILQTFVENSVKYAKLGGSRVPLEIWITISRLPTENGAYLSLSVKDNGQGYPQDILEETNGSQAEGGRSVGINNIKRRCRLLYGERVEFCFANMDGAYSEIIIPEKGEEP